MTQLYPHGIMFHHFFNSNHPKSQGAISEDQLVQIIEYIGKQQILTPEEWLDRANNEGLEKSDICLTFDDGLLCQYEIALPVLEHYKIKAFWFIYSSVIEGNIEMFEVYRKFRTVMFSSIEEFYLNFFKILEQSSYKKKVIKALDRFVGKKYLTDYSFYTNNDKKFRYIRDKILGPTSYNLIMKSMLKKYQIDVSKFSTDLWMQKQHLCKLQDSNHIIGLHSHTHPMAMAELSKEKQKFEYETNYRILYKILGKSPKTMSHPCNSYNKTTLRILKDLGINIGFRANMAKAILSPLEYPREDHINILTKIIS